MERMEPCVRSMPLLSAVKPYSIYSFLYHSSLLMLSAQQNRPPDFAGGREFLAYGNAYVYSIQLLLLRNDCSAMRIQR